MKKVFKYIFRDLLLWRDKELIKETHINRALQINRGTTYVEIGVQNGKCFRKIVATRKIGIDPNPLPGSYSLAAGELFYQMKSNDFFSLHAKEILGNQSIDVALVDGYHEFTQALQDISNLEKLMSPTGVIFIHDCNPAKREFAGGERIHPTWCGDVWKVADYTLTQRPDLTFFTLDCDYGLGVLTGFHTISDVLTPSKDIIQKYKQLDYSVLETQRKKILKLRPFWYSYIFFSLIFPHKKFKKRT